MSGTFYSGPSSPEEAAAYDSWYGTPAGMAILRTELAALEPLVEVFPSPRVEVGAGTGRFSGALGALFGVDSSIESLRLAHARGTMVAAGTGEALPLAGAKFGAVLITFTFCFLEDPMSGIAEARRLLVEGGGLVVGFLPRNAAWASMYAERGRRGHPVYSRAHFYSPSEVECLVTGAGFEVTGRRSTLRQPPGLDRYEVERAEDRMVEGAGFAAIAAVKRPIR
jgi:SAM-dependent methyltransferase